MKAYQIKIELTGSDPLIWRRVIMPADATFKRLNDVIHNVTNFKGGYPRDFYHVYELDLPDENIRVTNNDQAYEEHKHFKKNQKTIESKIKKAIEKESDPRIVKMHEAQLRNLQTVIRKPTGIKIDKYIEKYGQFDYLYDPGDNWQFLIILEEIVEDYHYGYPKLLDGAETAPPEDVGGLPGFYEFLKIYHDQNHPDHEHLRAWAKEQTYWEYNPEHINDILKGLKYKKTEWDKLEESYR